MGLGCQQHVAEIAEHVRADCLALEAASEPRQELLVDRQREVIRPELREPLEEGTIGRYRICKPRSHFCGVDRPQELRQTLLCSLLRLHGGDRTRGLLASGLDLTP